jgi:dipeptidyl aminopeptidase/acylaminoacyl peptidase
MRSTLHEQLVGCWGSWAPSLSPDARQVAFVSDRRGLPELWVQDLDDPAAAVVLPLSGDPVISAHWSADGQWLAASVATDGGVRTQVWAVRPDGSDARRVAGGPGRHSTLGPWSRSGHRLIVTTPPADADRVSTCDLIDPATGMREPVARGGLVNVIDLSADDRFALLRDGRRGEHFCVTLDREYDRDHALLPYPHTGSTEGGILRPSLFADGLIAYLVTDAGLPRASLAAVSIGTDGVRGEVGILAEREDGELELVDADDEGRLLSLVWNVGGRSVVELVDVAIGERSVVEGVPGEVVTGCVLARDGRCLVVAVDGPAAPPRLWRLDVASRSWRPVSEEPPRPELEFVRPTSESFLADDGLPLSGWLYRTPGSNGPGPVMVSLHGGPESQERPTFSAQHQAMLAAGISVFAPNVRGSSGFGRGFAHADDRYGRYDGIADVRSCVEHLLEIGVAEPGRVAVTGRSYGGYLTLAALVRYPELFAAGVDICGMSDLLTFFRDTEPWIAHAAISKYGHPEHDVVLLRELSPLHSAERISAPVLVVHGEHDTNVPIGEAHQMVRALRELGRPVQYLELPGEGHEYRRRASRLVLLDRLVGFLAGHLGPVRQD